MYTENNLNLKAAYRVMDIIRIDAPQVVLSDGTVLRDEIVRTIKDNKEALIMCATGGSKIMELIERLRAG